jgi:hypothetical protein
LITSLGSDARDVILNARRGSAGGLCAAQLRGPERRWCE